MANVNTVVSQVSGTIQLTLAPLTSAVISTTATAFRLNDGAISGTGGGPTPLQVAGAGSGIYLGTGRVIKLRGTGTIKTVASEALTLTLYQVPNSLLPIADTLAGQQTFTSWNSLSASTSVTINNATITESFTVEANLQLSSTGELQGTVGSVINNVVKAQTAISAVASLAEVDCNFILVATLGTGTTGTTITLTEFSQEQV